ncbi:Outer mitochondrial transmembrane helix translocase [Fulvia fulva]|uniref:Outer mitochondrial transmembrane helix translocase n=1 Tax=Passalora fulva TaxID=5499 RepID=A0A9Q8P484_PASFU|nr:Outer mitochondrial transmembrane helix translocase [Fulvia fulva]KAK4634982.1 Outer mitochondrial transmembrane helix translocase [Fulvia fulva]KAK4637552.1 Outer mitochondrial transmembrane helix translocase [Fulvia fulva]UJO12541.1 Outer mitochondrial transmembrane helix translocase [Fulvia fulva]WPV08206.1 Outer mitochondrial transmembrane helix translocase [Fulvia fulva]WPV24369.1 Outer mitochondrial transmembrane helix translocase [Fulvia fulva]
MKPVARQGVRLASNSRARGASRSRAFPREQVRCFSRHAPCQNDARGPHPPSDHSHTPSIEPRHEEQKKQSDPPAAAEQETEPKATDSTRKVGLTAGRPRRRRDNHTPEPPEPPAIPQWFLDHNVKLYLDTEQPNRSAKNAQILRCVDRETGHTLFTVPNYEAWPGGLQPAKAATPKKKALDQSFFDSKFAAPHSETPPETQPKATTETPAPTISTPPSDEAYNDVNPHALLRWVLLEAETAIIAGYSASREAAQASSTAASRVDVSLICPDSDSHDQMDSIVDDLANITRSNVIRIDASDFADLTADYVGATSDAVGSFSNLAYDVFDGYTSKSSQPGRLMEEDEEDEFDEDEEDEDSSRHNASDFPPGRLTTLDWLRQAILKSPGVGKALGKMDGIAIPFGMTMIAKMGPGGPSPFRSLSNADAPWDETRLQALLNSLLDAPMQKLEKQPPSGTDSLHYRLKESSPVVHHRDSMTAADVSYQALWRAWRSSRSCWLPDVAGLIAGHVNRLMGPEGALKLEAAGQGTTLTPSRSETTRTIVHVRDLKDVCDARMGDAIVRNLVRVVQKRRKAGNAVIIVGTTAQHFGSASFASFGQDTDETEFRSIVVPPFFSMSKSAQTQLASEGLALENTTDSTYRRILEINIRNIQSMLRRLRPGDETDLFSESSLRQLHFAETRTMGQKVMAFDQVQRLVLTAIGLSQEHATSEVVNASHIGLAAFITAKADRTQRAWSEYNMEKATSAARDRAQVAQGFREDADKGSARIEKLKKNCNSHESRLLGGVVDAQNIKTGFQQVHATPETIDALKTMTSLSLLRPDAFKYGVLAADRLPGLMLYGPPGTGKTLLAKAVAKESKATVLEISGAQVYEKYVGEGEKMVKAVFSLAKKLSPCIVFIDEADAIFGSRSSAGNRNTHREIINQFLREWDGMDLHNVFIMVASNRPFDMDDAVLRRLPRRILIDLPVAKDRESILGIHLKDEQLDDTVNLSSLAEQTPLYSGSDLKNLCVSAALACVREENELASSKEDDKDFKLPEKRTLSSSHFEKAIREISASISEDMGSLVAIRKFDEQYGDRKGRKKKTTYGFGTGDAGTVDENAALVRPRPPP